MKQWLVKSPVGPLYLTASPDALTGLTWAQHYPVPLARSLAGSAPETLILKQAVRQLEEYFAGKRREFDLRLDSRGTEFQKQVWAELRRIPYGKTRSYRDIAVRIRNEKAVRAVGTANGRNPICIVVPCHRVITSGGKLGGFAGGSEAKAKLLELERG